MPAGLDGNPDPIVTPQRTDVIEKVAGAVLAAKRPAHPLLVAIDGIDGAGKSTFADELADALASSASVEIVRSTIDSFHNPRADRMARGPSSPVGFFLDSHNLDAVRVQLLDPIRSGTGDFITAVFDEPTDSPVSVPRQAVLPAQVLLFDGIFLQREELRSYWDLVVFLDGHERVNLRRLGLVMSDLPADPAEVVGHVLEWNRRIDRYASGMRYYLDLVDPLGRADILVDNNDLAAPVIKVRSND